MNAEQLLKHEQQLEHDTHANGMYLAGAYDACSRLLSSPRFNRPQREVIEEAAAGYRERAEAQGVTFSGSDDDRG